MGGISSLNKLINVSIKWFCCVNRIAVSEMGLEYTSRISPDLQYWGQRFKESGWVTGRCGSSGWGGNSKSRI